MLRKALFSQSTAISIGFVLAVIALSSVASGGTESPDPFDQVFTGKTVRIDYHHSGHADLELISLQRIRVEGPWAGSRTRLLDDLNLGKYFFEIVDVQTQRVLYSRGFSSIYGEWETTGPAAAGTLGTLEETLRFPEPKLPFQVRMRKRDASGIFGEIWNQVVDPASRFVERPPIPPQRVWTLIENGPASEKVDLLVLGDGYVESEIGKFHADASRLAGQLFSVSPFAERKTDFNVRAIDTPAAAPGVSRPRAGIFRDSPVGASYNSLDSERYVLAMREHRWRDIAAAAPYEFVLILVNERKYGGGGIYNLYSTAAADSSYSRYLVIHEFGHHFAGLGDEYYTSDVAYEGFHGDRSEPWEPNITALLNPEQLKWKDLVAEGTPLPTPWEKETYEVASRANQDERRALRQSGAAEEEIEKLFDREREQFTAMLGANEYAGEMGAFEGAGYEATGLYRPSVDCIMFTRDEVGFCAVCSGAIERVIDLYTR